jgi:hypothetical protein
MTGDELRKIGFNDSVDVGKRTLHVQTEVIVRDGVLIRTMVLEGGIVRFVDRHVCPPALVAVDEIRAYANSRHERHVAAARQGLVDERWPA